MTFVSRIFDDTQVTWAQWFAEAGLPYERPRLVHFRDAVDSACGRAQPAFGSFYCPLDGTIYVDLDFYRELQDRFPAIADFTQAYILAHEVGHHVQALAARREPRDTAYGRDIELQAECLAGMYLRNANTRRTVTRADIVSALNAVAVLAAEPLTDTHRKRADWVECGVDNQSYPCACKSQAPPAGARD